MAQKREDSGLMALGDVTFPTGAPTDGGSGLIDMNALQSAGLVGDGEVPPQVGGPTEPPVEAPPPPRLGFWLAVAGVTLMMVSVGIVVTWLLLRDGDSAPGAAAPKSTPGAASKAPPSAPESAAVASEAPPSAPESAAVASEAPPSAPESAAVASEAPPSAPESVAVASEAPPSAPESVAVASEAPPSAPESAAVASEAPPSAPESVAVLAAPATEAPPTETPPAPATEAPATEAPPTEAPPAPATEAPASEAAKVRLPRQLSKAQVVKVIQSNEQAVRRCQRQAKKATRVEVAVTIDRSGAVYRAIPDAPETDTDLGKCVARAVKKFVFPPFAGDPMRIRLPYAF